MKMMLKISLTAIFLVFCAILPSRFAPAPDEVSTPNPNSSETIYYPIEDFSQRAALFNEKFNFSEGRIDGVSFDPGRLDRAAQKAIEEHIAFILEACTVDMKRTSETGPHGVDFIEVYGSDGSSIRLVQYYDGWDGDWQNWVRIIMDVDTFDLYFLYISSECLQNHEMYEELPSHYSLSRFLSGYTGYSNISEARLSEGETSKIIYTFTSSYSGAQIAYDISGAALYRDSEPMLVDYVIQCLPSASMARRLEEADAIN